MINWPSFQTNVKKQIYIHRTFIKAVAYVMLQVFVDTFGEVLAHRLELLIFQ